MLESQIQRRFLAAVRGLRGMFATKIVNVGGRGLPDVLFVNDGYVTFIEFKKVDGELRPEQEICHDRLRKAGAHVVTLYGWEQTKEFCKREGIPL